MNIPETTAEAYWISPDGEIIPVKEKHIHVLCSQHRRFGLTSNDVNTVFQKYKEPLFSEGRARNELMAAVFKKGWIRLRFNCRTYCWTIETCQFTRRIIKNICTWLNKTADCASQCSKILYSDLYLLNKKMSCKISRQNFSVRFCRPCFSRKTATN